MRIEAIVNELMFDWGSISPEKFEEYCALLSPKLLRWLGAHHPDNRTRLGFFKKTNIKVGEQTVINQNFVVSDNYEPLLTIGSRVAISPNVTVVCASGPNNSNLQHVESLLGNVICEKEVVIGDDVWIGAGAVILPGVAIGEKTIIGAGAVVTKSVEANSIYAGNPATRIRKI